MSAVTKLHTFVLLFYHSIIMSKLIMSGVMLAGCMGAGDKICYARNFFKKLDRLHDKTQLGNVCQTRKLLMNIARKKLILLTPGYVLLTAVGDRNTTEMKKLFPGQVSIL